MLNRLGILSKHQSKSSEEIKLTVHLDDRIHHLDFLKRHRFGERDGERERGDEQRRASARQFNDRRDRAGAVQEKAHDFVRITRIAIGWL